MPTKSPDPKTITLSGANGFIFGLMALKSNHWLFILFINRLKDNLYFINSLSFLFCIMFSIKSSVTLTFSSALTANTTSL